MEELKCGKCGNKMEYIDIHEVDINAREGKIWIVEKWECLECRKMEKIEIIGKMTEIVRNV